MISGEHTSKCRCTPPIHRLTIFRTTTIASLLFLTVIGGYFAYTLTYENEKNVLDSQFMSSAQQLEVSVMRNMNQKVLVMSSLAALLTISCPDSAHWPNCAVPMPKFLDNTDPIIELDKLRTLQYLPAVLESEVSSFETFAYDLFEQYGYDNLGHSEWGQGIFGVNESGKYHSTEPHSSADYPYLFPVLQTGNLPNNLGAIMYNVYTGWPSVVAINAMLNCTEELIANSTKVHTEIGQECASITDVIMLAQDGVFNPAIVVRLPVIVPHNITDPSSPLTMVGLVATVNNWDTVLSDIIPPSSSKLRVIIKTEREDWSYDLVDGVAKFLQVGAIFNQNHAYMGHHFSLPVFKGEVTYSISVYPTLDLIDDFMTNSPVINCSISVSVIMLTCIIFITYDGVVQREVEKKERAKLNFVRFISHEMRTPLNTVSLGLKLLLDQIASIVIAHSSTQSVILPVNVLSEWNELVMSIEDGSHAAADVLDDLINYDKIAMGLMVYTKVRIDMWALVFECVKKLKLAAQEAGVSLRLDMAVNRDEYESGHIDFLKGLMALGDDAKIEAVLMNLITSSVKHTKSGGVVTVRVDWSKFGLPYVPAEQDLVRGGSLIIEVKDDGVGMEPEAIRGMFKEGRQFLSNKTQVGQGSGLGLWISKGILEKHGGKIQGASAGQDKGSTFVVEIPVLYRRLDTKSRMSGSEVELCSSGVKKENVDYNDFNVLSNDVTPRDSPLMGAKTNGSRFLYNVVNKDAENFPCPPILSSGHSESMDRTGIKRILVVDDVAVCRKVLRRTLTVSGYECFEAVDGQDCLDKMEALSLDHIDVDLILLDFEMPRMNGPTAARKLRDSGCTIPIIGVTGNVLEKDTDFFLSQGADKVLFKPLAIDLLRTAVFNAATSQSKAESPQLLEDRKSVLVSTSLGHEADNF